MSEFSTTIIESMNTPTDFPVVEFTFAITVIVIFAILAIVMFCMIMHLVYKTYKKWNKMNSKRNKDNKKLIVLIFFLVATVFGILCFELSLLTIIAVVVQIFLLDDTIKSSTISSTFFFQSYHTFEYFIAILDSLGHLSMLLIFIGRFQYAFNNPLFNQSQWLIRSLYTMLIILSLLSVFLIAFVIPSEIHKHDLLALEIIWELCVESMILLILFLFVSNLYKLLKLSLLSHLQKNGNPKELLSEITKISLETSKSSGKKRSKNGTSKKSNKITLTIDGNVVDPIEPTSNKSANTSIKSANKSANTSIKSNGYQSADGNTTDHEDMEHDDTKSKPESNARPASYVGYSQTIEILTVMSKMTLLVIIAAIGSFLTIIGNFIIESYGEFNEKDLSSDEGVDHDAIWVFILPVADMFITALMLYLQFNFTHKIYRVMCHCLDSLFLRCMLGIIGYCWNIEKDKGIVDNKSEGKELQTKSTVTSDPSNPTAPSAPSEDIELQMQTLTVMH